MTRNKWDGILSTLILSNNYFQINVIEAKLNVLIDLQTAHDNIDRSRPSSLWRSMAQTKVDDNRLPVLESSMGTSYCRNTGRLLSRDQTNLGLRHLSLPEEDTDIETIKEEVDLVPVTHIPPVRNPPEFYAVVEKYDDNPDETDIHCSSSTNLVPLPTAHGTHFNVSSDNLLNSSTTDVYFPESEVSSATTDASLSNQVRVVAVPQPDSPVNSSSRHEDQTNFIT